MYDVIVIGAGPSGMFAALTAAKQGKNVLLIEKNEDVGKKMRITGGGRCNITNFKDTNEFISSLPTRNGRFLYSSLNNFNPYDIYYFFESIGVPLKIEPDDKVFPVSDQSMDFIHALKKEMNTHHVTIKCNTEVLNLKLMEDHKRVITKQEIYDTKNLVIATGGKSYPHTGSSGQGHEFGIKANHTLTELFPTETPLISNDPIIASKRLQGLSFKEVQLSLLNQDNQIVKSHLHDLIFTHFGLSGPAALKLSQFVYHHLQEHRVAHVALDVLPNETNLSIIDEIKSRRQESPNKKIKNVLSNLSQSRYLEFLYEHLTINQEQKIANMSNNQIDDFVQAIKGLVINIHDVRPIKNAFVTGGGISLDEINPKTMESKLIPGLYFIGEVLDLHGYTGGYNMTIALSTGYTAGISIQ
ncbi:BaiN/RdsA family NAD(P)/FAD-dependent oxidoreductase [Haloplasma contractile]|nr:NAD(P)/FAD-dependent oxidoreductase [Haloplasma contractile]